LVNVYGSFSNNVDITQQDGSGVCQGLRSFTSDSGCEGTLGGNASIDAALNGNLRVLKES